MAVEGAPRLDAAKQQWLAPVSCRTTRGILPAGEVHLDSALGIIYATPRDEMLRVVEAQLKRLPFIVLGEEKYLEAKGVALLEI